MDDSSAGLHLDGSQTAGLIKSLEDIRDRLKQANESFGYLAQYNSMKQEIRRLGWAKVCAKYHPDVNTGESAAFELFALYKFVYDTMDRMV